ncbi:MAG: hypothetical protein SFV54_05105 [Bryobacteraceae bacterium]|nr:hypothetical protein [Bryobacteraceae bacterium]
MAFTEAVKEEVLLRAAGRCECLRRCEHHAGRRCDNSVSAHNGHFRHRIPQWSGGPDTSANCELLCPACYAFAASFGTQ